MKRNILPFVVLALLCLGYLLFVSATASQMPERVAMHFGLTGHADGWASRHGAAAFFIGMGWGVAVLFVVFGSVMKWMPNWTFNLPNRDYWLAPERRAETIEIISRQLTWLASVMVLFFYGLYGLTILANRATPAQLPMNLFLCLLVMFLLFIGVWSMGFIRYFGKRPTGRV